MLLHQEGGGGGNSLCEYMYISLFYSTVPETMIFCVTERFVKPAKFKLSSCFVTNFLI